jgi:hypothetical protein
VYPTEAQKQEFHQWASRKKAPRAAAPMETPAPELLTLVAKTNFNIESEKKIVKSAVNGTPLTLGSKDGNKYLIVPRIDALVVDGGGDTVKTADALDHAFLWIDTPTTSTKTTSSNADTASTAPTDPINFKLSTFGKHIRV